jgi:hypothetical protein
MVVLVKMVFNLIMNYEKIIISDIHLGSDVCQSKKLNEFLILVFDHSVRYQPDGLPSTAYPLH